MMPTLQQCSKCGKPFMGSDAIEFPILCNDCKSPNILEECPSFNYDEEVDVMYIIFGKPLPLVFAIFIITMAIIAYLDMI